jgi:hypothetical protein
MQVQAEVYLIWLSNFTNALRKLARFDFDGFVEQQMQTVEVKHDFETRFWLQFIFNYWNWNCNQFRSLQCFHFTSPDSSRIKISPETQFQSHNSLCWTINSSFRRNLCSSSFKELNWSPPPPKPFTFLSFYIRFCNKSSVNGKLHEIRFHIQWNSPIES